MLESRAASVVGSREALLGTSPGEADRSCETTAVHEGSACRRLQAPGQQRALEIALDEVVQAPRSAIGLDREPGDGPIPRTTSK
jgi:hypothetical protein